MMEFLLSSMMRCLARRPTLDFMAMHSPEKDPLPSPKFFAFRLRNVDDDVRMVIEMGNTMYNLSCFPDTWQDTKTILRDFRQLLEERV